MTIARSPLITIITRRHRSLGASLLVGLSLALAPTALAQGPEEQGARLLSEVERGEADCADLDDQDFAAIGEFVMGRMQMMGGGTMGGFGGMMGGPVGSGQGYGPAAGSGAMMGFDRGVDAEGDDDGDLGAWMAILMLVLVAGVGVAAFAIARPKRAGSAPLDLLAQRFARGEMTTDDYEQRRALLEGGDR